MIQLARSKAGIPFIAGVAAVLLVLTGCAGTAKDAEASEVTFEQSLNGVSLSITLEAEGDRLVKEETLSTLEYEANGFADKAAAKEALEALVGEFPVIDGMTHSIDYRDTSATERVVIDYSVVDPAELAELNGTALDEEAQKASVSLKARSEQLETSGFIMVK